MAFLLFADAERRAAKIGKPAGAANRQQRADTLKSAHGAEQAGTAG